MTGKNLSDFGKIEHASMTDDAQDARNYIFEKLVLEMGVEEATKKIAENINLINVMCQVWVDFENFMKE